MCDAAIGLKGLEGTISEVTFSLALQRPAVFVGDHWKESGSLDDSSRPALLTSMVTHAFNRVGRTPSGNRDLDILLNEDIISTALDQLPPYMYLASSDALEIAVGWIEGVLKCHEKAGHFPALEGYEHVIAKYQNWFQRNWEVSV